MTFWQPVQLVAGIFILLLLALGISGSPALPILRKLVSRVGG